MVNKKILTEQEIYETKKYYAEKARELRLQQRDDIIQASIDIYNSAVETDRNLTETYLNIQQNKFDNEEKLLKKQLDSKAISQEEYDKRLASSTDNLDKKLADIRKKAAIREKAYAVASTVISTAQSIVGMLTVKPVTPFNFALAAAAAVLGAAQIAKIVSTPLGDDTKVSPSSSSSVNTPSSGAGTGTAPSTSFTFTPNNQGVSLPSPIKTYVLSKDVKTQSQMDRQIVSNGSI